MQENSLEKNKQSGFENILKNDENRQKLIDYFSLLVQIDQRIKKENETKNNRDTDYSS
ncbi:MAG: hypothetical protein KatS3mg096_818 [Candidatus Parcubacteria bacterium]|nr:MAG: hypothetical protein KatS3mg096_818 [Candidatus Parcubacteria bacterium]